MPVTFNEACVQGKRSCKREREICVVQRNRTWVWVCVSLLNQSPVHSYLCVCVCHESARHFFSLRGLLRRLLDVVIWEYNTIFNTKYFIINSKILSYVVAIVQRRQHTYTYIHTQEAIDGRVMMTETHTHAYP